MSEKPNEADIIETLAEMIYTQAMERHDGPKPAWVPRGNSLKQDEARRIARKGLAYLKREGALDLLHDGSTDDPGSKDCPDARVAPAPERAKEPPTLVFWPDAGMLEYAEEDVPTVAHHVGDRLDLLETIEGRRVVGFRMFPLAAHAEALREAAGAMKEIGT